MVSPYDQLDSRRRLRGQGMAGLAPTPSHSAWIRQTCTSLQAQVPISRQVRHEEGLKRILKSTLQGLHLPLAVAGRVILSVMVLLRVRYVFEKH
jgi:hypothetical protein